jgi:hypothetical protein
MRLQGHKYVTGLIAISWQINPAQAAMSRLKKAVHLQRLFNFVCFDIFVAAAFACVGNTFFFEWRFLMNSASLIYPTRRQKRVDRAGLPKQAL